MQEHQQPSCWHEPVYTYWRCTKSNEYIIFLGNPILKIRKSQYDLTFTKMFDTCNKKASSYWCRGGWVSCGGYHERKPKDHHTVSSGWSRISLCSNTGLFSTQYEQIPIIFGLQPFWLTLFLLVSDILSGLWYHCEEMNPLKQGKQLVVWPGFNLKMPSCQYRKSYWGYKTIISTGGELRNGMNGFLTSYATDSVQFSQQILDKEHAGTMNVFIRWQI